MIILGTWAGDHCPLKASGLRLTKKKLLVAAFIVCGLPARAFTPPEESKIPSGPFGDSVRRGEAIFVHTQDNGRPYVGNAMNCSNCHLDRGRKAGAAPMWGA